MTTFSFNDYAGARQVPLSLRVQLLFSGNLPQIFGWLFFGFGMLFVWIFLPKSTFFTRNQYIGHLESTPGTVIRVWDTGNRENDTIIYGVRYTFSPAEGLAQQGTSYTQIDKPDSGASVMVEYRPDNYTVSRVVGMHEAPFSQSIADVFIFLFPGIGLLFILFQWCKGWKQISLMQRGVQTQGRFVKMKATGVEINDRRLMEVLITFTTMEGREASMIYRTTNPDPKWDLSSCAPTEARLAGIGKIPLIGPWLRENAERYYAPRTTKDEPIPEIPLLYDPANPRRCLLLSEMPDKVTITNTTVSGGSPLRAIGALVIPTLVIAGQILFILKLMHN